jgi:hypothetical protein
MVRAWNPRRGICTSWVLTTVIDGLGYAGLHMHQLGAHLSVCLSQKLANNDVLNVSCDVTTKTNPESFGERKTSAQVNSI